MIDIVLCTDENYAPYCAVVIASAILNSEKPKDLRFFILTPGLKQDTTALIRSMVAKYESRVEFITFNTQVSDSVDLKRFGLGTIMRLYMHRHLPQDCNRVIYLDCDLAILGDLAKLYSQDLGGHAVGAVLDLCSPDTFAQQSAKYQYCNAGVLLVDLKLWRDQKIGERALDCLQNTKVDLEYLDQDALNYVLSGDWQELGLSWNFQPAAYVALEKSYPYLVSRHAELKLAVAKPDIVHYIGGVKPWHANCTHPLQKLFIEFSAYTPWPIDIDKLRGQLSFKEKLRLLLKQPKINKRASLLKYEQSKN